MTARIDINGWKERRDNPLSCVGVYPYMGRDIPGAEDPNKIYHVLRPEEELADPACIESFKLIPWVDEHTLLGEDHTPAEMKGLHGVIGEDVYYADGFLRGNLKVFSESMGALIDSGKRELSCGYRCRYEYAPGVYNGVAYDYVQRSIRGNHIALVREGRMGPAVCVLDGVDLTFTFTLDSKELTAMADEENKPAESGGEGEMTLADVIKFVKEVGPQLAEMQKALAGIANPAAPVDPDATPVAVDEDGEKKDEVIAAMDAQIKSLTTTVQALKSDGTRTVLGELAKRAALVQKVTPFVGVFDHANMTLDEAAKYSVKQLGLTCDSGHEITAIEAYLKDRKAPSAFTTSAVAQDGKSRESQIDAYLTGGAK